MTEVRLDAFSRVAIEEGRIVMICLEEDGTEVKLSFAPMAYHEMVSAIKGDTTTTTEG